MLNLMVYDMSWQAMPFRRTSVSKVTCLTFIKCIDIDKPLAAAKYYVHFGNDGISAHNFALILWQP